MRVCTFSLLIWIVSALCGHGANFPYIRLNGKTNIISDSGTGMTYNGFSVGGVQASIATGSLIFEHRLTEGGGFTVRNSTAQYPGDIGIAWPGELVWASPEWWGAVSPAYLTPSGFLNPNNEYTAARFFPTNSHAIGLNCNFPVTGGYVMSEWVKSNVSSNQTFRSHFAGNWSSDATVSTNWTRFVWTNDSVTVGSRLIVPVSTDSTDAATDILFWGLKIERLTTPTPYYSEQFNAILGIAAQTNALAPSWNGNALHFTQYGVGGYGPRITVWSSSPAKFDAATVYCLMREYDTVALNGTIPLMTDVNLTIKLLENASDYPQFDFNGKSVFNYGMRLDDAQWHLVTGTYSGTNMAYYVDDVLVATNIVAAANPFESFMFFGGGLTGSSLAFQGDIGYESVYNVGHSYDQVKANYRAICDLAASKGITVAKPSALLVFEGDSLTAGSAKPRTGYVWYLSTNTVPKPWVANFATSGSGLGSVSEPNNTMTNRAAMVDSVARAGATNILTFMIGSNDLVGSDAAWVTNWFGRVKDYCLGRRAAGYKINLITCPPRVDYNPQRNIANSLFLSDPSFYDKIVRADLDPDIGVDTAVSNLTWFADGVHLTDAGQARLALWVKTNLNLLLSGH